MKKILSIFSAFALIAMSLSVSSCGFEDDNAEPLTSAIVTVKYDSSDRCFFQVNKNTVVYPTNIKKPFGGREVRALTQFAMRDGVDQAEVFYLDSILTKKAVNILDAEDNKVSGNDPINIIPDWCTVAEDGYITIHFTAAFSGIVNHYVNLVTGVNPEDPYEVEFKHDAKGDIGGYFSQGYAAFNIKDILPEDTKDITFTIKYKSFDGERSIRLAYEK